MTYFVFDADFNVVREPPEAAWPVAIVDELRTCVRRAHDRGAATFGVADDAATWRIVPLDRGGPHRLAVFPERA